MKRYDLIKNTREISYKDRDEVCQGCTLDQMDQEPETLKSFDDKDEALEALKKYQSEISKLGGGAGTYYIITEYYVQINEYDEDGDWIGGGDVLDFAEMPQVEA